MVVCVWQHSVRMLLRGEICFIINMVASTCSSIFTDHYWLGTVLVKNLLLFFFKTKLKYKDCRTFHPLCTQDWEWPTEG